MELDLKTRSSSPETAAAETAAREETPDAPKARHTPAAPRRRKLSRRELLIILLPALAAVLAVVVVLLTLERGSSYRLKDTAYQYYGGNSARIESGTELKRGENGAALLVQDGRSAETTLPIYLENSRSVVFPTDMLYFTPRSGGCGRLVYFSELECKANGTVTVARGGDSANPGQGFLYDGGDLYLFLEPMILSFNGYTMEVPALSYVEAVYGGYMMVFHYDTKEFFIELSDGSGTAQPPSGDYVISLLGDSMTLYDGSRILLATRPELFDPIV